VFLKTCVRLVGRFDLRRPSSRSEAADDRKEIQMSDQESRDTLDTPEEGEEVEAHGFSQPKEAPHAKDEDVEAHGFSQPKEAPHAKEEPPDVEGHSFGKPHYAPKDAPKD
jgi:hypothetical protein